MVQLHSVTPLYIVRKLVLESQHMHLVSAFLGWAFATRGVLQKSCVAMRI
jgi:hypothetical protein